MLKILGVEVRLMVTKAMVIKALVMDMVRVMGRPIVGPMSGMII